MVDKYADKAKGGRSCRRADGAPKRPFVTQEAADETVSRGVANGKHLRAYQCPSCFQWHVATDRSAEDGGPWVY